MQNLGSAISEKLELSQILNFITASSVKSTNAQAGAILLIDEFDSLLKVEAVSGVFPPPYQVPDRVKVKISSLQDYFKSQPIKPGETIFGEVAKSGKPVFIKNTLQDPRMKQNTQSDTLFVSSFIAIPLIVSKRIIGVISVIKRERDKLFTENDYDHLRTFANYSSMTIDFILTYLELIEKKEMERELGIAAEIQQKLLPRKLPVLRTASLSAFSIPAKGV
ncbi:MAG: GAF domain-containing protein, partial [Spirochaetaceae bacterium]